MQLIGIIVPAFLLATSGHFCRASTEQKLDEMAAKLISRDNLLSIEATVELLERMEKMDRDYLVGQAFGVGKLLAYSKPYCDPRSMVELSVDERAAEMIYSSNNNNNNENGNSLLNYLKSCQREHIVECAAKLVSSLAEQQGSMDPKDDQWDLIRRDTKAAMQQLAQFRATGQMRAGPSGTILAACRQAHDHLEIFYLISQGAKKHNLDAIAEDERINKWSELFLDCDRLLYLTKWE